MSITYTLGNPATLARSIPADMMRAHWEECDMGEGGPVLNLELYDRMYLAGYAFAIVAEKAGECIGYVSVVISPGHISTARHAQSDVIYVSPKYRDTLAAGRLMQYAEREAVRRGAVRFVWACNPVNRFAVSLQKHGYKTDATLMGRKL